MYKLNDFLALLEEYAPLNLSHKMIEKGGYDNSGIIVNSGKDVQKVLFSLDLTCDCVDEAKKLGVDTIVTHHPAIYSPVKSLSVEDDTKAVLLATVSAINVISMHLNLDLANQGIDHYLSKAFGAKDYKILDPLCDGFGYGREFEFSKNIEDLAQSAKQTFKTDKILVYGSGEIARVATFCGSGADIALDLVRKGACTADVIITSDIAHHEIKELIERGKKIIVLPHYVSEEYGFNKFYLWTSEKTDGKAKVYYYDDKRFR